MIANRQEEWAKKKKFKTKLYVETEIRMFIAPTDAIKTIYGNGIFSIKIFYILRLLF